MKRVVSLLLLVVASTARLPGQVSSPPRGITVYAAASLTDALLELTTPRTVVVPLRVIATTASYRRPNGNSEAANASVSPFPEASRRAA